MSQEKFCNGYLAVIYSPKRCLRLLGWTVVALAKITLFDSFLHLSLVPWLVELFPQLCQSLVNTEISPLCRVSAPRQFFVCCKGQLSEDVRSGGSIGPLLLNQLVPLDLELLWKSCVLQKCDLHFLQDLVIALALGKQM